MAGLFCIPAGIIAPMLALSRAACLSAALLTLADGRRSVPRPATWNEYIASDVAIARR